MFDTAMLESETGHVRIVDATLPAMRAVVAFCYSAEIEFTEEITPWEVLEIAHKYEMDLLERTAEEALIKSLDTSNLIRRLKLAKKVGAKLLQASGLEYLKTNFDDAIGAVVDEVF
jgi:hypothetical protein